MRLDEGPHVVVCVLEQKLEPIDLNCISNGKVARAVVHWLAWVAPRQRDLACIKEFAAKDASISLRRLVDGDVVVGKVKGYDESAGDVLWLGIDKLAQEAENLVAKLKELEIILLGRLGHKSNARLQCVLRLPDARMGRDGGSRRGRKRLGDVDRSKVGHAKVAAVELLCKLVAFVKKEWTARLL